MAELTAQQRQLLASGLKGAWPIPGSNQILPPQMAPYGFSKAYPELNGLPSPVAQAIAPNLGINFGRKGDFVTGVNPPLTNESDPRMMNVSPPTRDRALEMQDRPWDNDLLLRRT